MAKRQLEEEKTKLTAEGIILSIIGFILFFDFMSIDSLIFNTTAPAWITKISNIFQVSPLFIDILTTIALVTVIFMLGTERKVGRLE